MRVYFKLRARRRCKHYSSSHNDTRIPLLQRPSNLPTSHPTLSLQLHDKHSGITLFERCGEVLTFHHLLDGGAELGDVRGGVVSLSDDDSEDGETFLAGGLARGSVSEATKRRRRQEGTYLDSLLSEGHGFRDVQSMDVDASSRLRLVVLCNPNECQYAAYESSELIDPPVKIQVAACMLNSSFLR